MSDLIWLSKAQRRRIGPHIPLSHGVPRVDDRRVVSGIVFVSLIAIVATLNGIVVHMIMIARVLYGLAKQGNLPRHLTQFHKTARTPIVATAYAIAAILILTLAVPFEGLADLAAQGTLIIFAAINLALILIKPRQEPPPPGAFICWGWLSYAGLVSSSLMLLLSIVA